ncbi:MAG: hypothetical protein ACYDIE_06955, partial [Candidatus Krumholzibacteriia bacterium]
MAPAGAAQRRADLLWPLAAGLLFGGVWIADHPPVPPEPSADLYENLSVAQHLVRGDGFVCDLAYPLSFAFPFAARLPQPLIHRPPGYPLLLTLPVLVARGDRQAAVRDAQLLNVILLALLAAGGVRVARRAGRPEAALPWLALLAASPLLAMTTGWAQSETPAALLLALLWWRLRDDDGAAAARPASPARPPAAVLVGTLAAATALLRADLWWLPWRWLATRGRLRRAALAAVAAWLALMAPWGVRNARLTGNPCFALQIYGEAVKETAAWPGLDVYRQLTPQPLLDTIRHDPALLARKTAAGLRYFAVRAGRWLPWPLWLAAGLLLVRGGRGRPRRRTPTPLALLLLSTGLLVLQYAVLSHTLRYLATLLPVLGLEIWLGAAAWLRARCPAWPTPARVGALAGAALVLQLAAPARLPGWEAARAAAIGAQPVTARAVAEVALLPPG